MFTYLASHATWMVLIASGLTAIALVTLLLGRSRRISPAARPQPDRFSQTPVPVEGASIAAAGDTAFLFDIATEIRTVIGRLGSEFRQRNVRVSTAIQPDLIAAADPAVFRQVMTDLFGTALQRAPRSEVLVAASRAGGWVEVAVSDDGAVAGLHAAESALRGASQLIAMQGGALEIDMRPGEGTITTIRLSASTESRAPTQVPAPIVTRAIQVVV